MKHACDIASPSLLINWSPIRVFVQGEESSILSQQLAVVLEQQYETPTQNVEVHEDQSDHMALILSSSGSTGLPKGVAISHRNVVATLMSR